MAHGSILMAHASSLVVHGSRLMTPGPGLGAKFFLAMSLEPRALSNEPGALNHQPSIIDQSMNYSTQCSGSSKFPLFKISRIRTFKDFKFSNMFPLLELSNSQIYQTSFFEMIKLNGPNFQISIISNFSNFESSNYQISFFAMPDYAVFKQHDYVDSQFS